MIKPALHYEQVENDQVVCHLCPAECWLDKNQYGICGCRFNKDGKLATDNYGEVVTLAVDPIEKKPLYHFYPGSNILSTGPNGCNLNCLNCQNWTISQEKIKTTNIEPNNLLELAIQRESIGVAFTYTEPMIWYEYILDCAPLLKEVGLKTVLVSNGYINMKPLEQIIKYIDAINIDLKSMNEKFYLKVCKGKLQPVLDNIEYISKTNTHLELTTLLIPGQNDSDEELEKLTDFIANISPQIPLHLSAYHPDYKLDLPATPLKTLLRAKEIAQKKLNYVYLGNVLTDEGSDTFCPGCNHKLISRGGYKTEITGLKNSKCLNCSFETGIVQ